MADQDTAVTEAEAEIAESVGVAESEAAKESENALKGIDDILSADAEDESLRRYKEQLLGAAAAGNVGDASGPRVKIESFDVIFEDNEHEDMIFPQGEVSDLVIKEKASYKFRIKFRVNGDIVAGLTYKNKVKKMGVVVDSDEVMLGSYPPAPEPHEFIFPRHEYLQAPSGMTGRGKYTIANTYTDDGNVEHLKTSFQVTIAKEWAS